MRRGYLSLGVKDIFHPKGRIDRLTYWMYGVILGMITYGVLLSVGLLYDIIAPKLPASPYAYLIVLLIGIAPIVWGQFCIRVKRLHDIGLPGFLAILGFADLTAYAVIAAAVLSILPERWVSDPEIAIREAQLFAIIFHLLLLFIPGQRGPNRYGESSAGPALPKPKILEG